MDVCIFDCNKLFKDEFMGKVEIPVKSLQFDVPVEGWYPLQPLTAGKIVHGELFLKVLLTKG